jgi:WD40 repeat protein
MSRRIALIIGISDYENQLRLDNAGNDSGLVKETLTQRSFEILSVSGTSSAEIDQALTSFKTAILEAGASGEQVFSVAYFAGHGVEVAGAAYFLPRDFPDQVSPGSLQFMGVSLESVIDAMSGADGPKLVVLDMCRGHVDTSTATDVSTLSDMVQQNRKLYQKASEAHNLLIAYSTSAGDDAGDGVTGNSRYTVALCDAMLRHDRSVHEVFAEVGAAVIAQTAARQRPWYYSSLSSQVRFSDIPTPDLVASTVLIYPASPISRLCPNQDSVVYHKDRKVMTFQGLESGIVFTTDEPVEAVAVTPEGILVADAKRLLLCSRREKSVVANHGVDHVAGIEVSPGGRRAAVFGIHSFSVFDLKAKDHATIALRATRRQRSFHGGTWIDDDRLVLCCSNGTLTIVTFDGAGHSTRQINLGHHHPCYDAEVMEDFQLLVVSCARGMVNFLDLTSFKHRGELDLTHAAVSRADTYSHLREAGLSSDEALQFLDDPDSVHSMYEDPDYRQALDDALPTRHLLCLSRTGDPRLLAVGADDGFVVLLDVRTRDVAHVIDCGGGRGDKLAWMTVVEDNSIIALSSRGTFNRFKQVPLRW